MKETTPNFVNLDDNSEKYKYTKDPDQFSIQDAVAARFGAIEKAVSNNPEKRGLSTAILAANYMVFGEDRVDLKRLGNDVLLPRLLSYLVAYNDQVDLAEKIKESDPDVYTVIMDHVQLYKDKLDEYFAPTGDQAEDERHLEFKKYFDVAFLEVDVVEHELFNVAQPTSPKDTDTTTNELNRITQGRELVNAIETIMNIRACVGKDIFDNRQLEEPTAPNIASLSKKYAWLIDTNYDISTLSPDERKARMLYLVAMSDQAALDELDYKEDRWFNIWKKMTYMTEVIHMDPKEAAHTMHTDSDIYAESAAQLGMSPLAISAANKFARTLTKTKNLTYGSDKVRELVATRAEKRGHIREKAINLLRSKHPNQYKY